MPAKKLTTIRKNKPAAAAEPLPDWVTEKPHAIEFRLETCDYNANEPVLEQVDMTQEEYLALKLHLAKLRGYDVSQVEAAAA